MGSLYPKLLDLGEVAKNRGCCRAAAGGTARCNRQLEQTHRCHCLGRVTALIMTGQASVRGARSAAVGIRLVTAPGATNMLKPNTALRSYLEVEISSIVVPVRCRSLGMLAPVCCVAGSNLQAAAARESSQLSIKVGFTNKFRLKKVDRGQIPSSRSILIQARHLAPQLP
jgi:hypothetical protein